MRKRLLAGLTLVAVLALAASAAAAKGKSMSASSSAVTSVLTVNANKATGAVVARGYILVAKKNVPVHWFATVTKSDAQGNTCGKPTKYQSTARYFKFKLALPGGFKVAVTMRTAKKYNGRYYSKSKVLKQDLGAGKIICGSQTTVIPDPSQVCDWGRPSDTPPGTCGVAIEGAPAWLGKPTRIGNTITSGNVGSPSATCKAEAPTNAPPNSSWLGFALHPLWWKCSDGTTVQPGLNGIWLADKDGNILCQGKPPYDGAYITSFQIPPEWGGNGEQLFVNFAIVVYPSGKYENSNAKIALNPSGTTNGCAQLTAGS